MAHSLNKSKFDSIVIGAGIMGLWAANYLVKEERSVCVVEAAHIGAGASGGILGALMPHMPDHWDNKKAFQFQALERLESEIDSISPGGAGAVGFRRCGRLMPLPHDRLGNMLDRRINGAELYWHGRYAFDLLDSAPGIVAAHGLTFDSFSARVHPQKLLQALETHLNDKAAFLFGRSVEKLVPKNGQVLLDNGDVLEAGEIIVANGWRAYDLLKPHWKGLPQSRMIGRGVKGQSVLLEYSHEDDWPIVYADGIYIVPHPENKVAVGSTSRGIWDDEYSFDPADMEFLDKAFDVMPALKSAKTISRWAGVRPRNTLDHRGTSPWFGAVPGHDNVIALIGGFKISFGIAHMAMDVARGNVPDPV